MSETQQEPKTYEAEINVFVHSPEGFDAHIKIAGVPHNLAAGTLAALSQHLADKYNMTAPQRFGGGSGGSAPKAPQEASQGGTAPSSPAPAQGPAPACNFCHGPVYDNRNDPKRKGRMPHFKCRDKDCGGAAWIQEDGGLKWSKPL